MAEETTQEEKQEQARQKAKQEELLRFKEEDRDPDDHEFGYLKSKRQERLHFSWKDMSAWQHKRMVLSLVLVIGVAIVFLAIACTHVYSSNRGVEDSWDSYMGSAVVDENTRTYDKLVESGRTDNATHVRTAIYLAGVRSIDMANSSYQVSVEAAFRWQGNDELDFSKEGTITFYRGLVNQSIIMDESHENGINYQLIKFTATITKDYDTTCFPLGTHLMCLYMEPGQATDKLVLEPDSDTSYVDKDLDVSGFNLLRFGVRQVVYTYQNAMLNPSADNYSDTQNYKTTILTAFMMERADVGMYFECFIALFGTLAWIILCLYICTYRRIDPLTMISAAFFGAVSNVLAGAAKVPLSLSFGLLIYGNLFGIGLIIAGTAIVISINTLRKDIGSRAFAHYYGRIMMKVFIVVAIVGNVALPLCAVL